MPCCGSRRRQIVAATEPARLDQSLAAGTLPSAPQAAMRFVYQGDTALTVVGSVTGRRYRFSYAGAELAIDPRDVRSVAGVPVLRRVMYG